MREFFKKLFAWAVLIWIFGYLCYLLGYGIDLYKGRNLEFSENFIIMTSTLLFLIFTALGLKYAEKSAEVCQRQCDDWYKINACWRAGVCDLLRECADKRGEEGIDKEYLEMILNKWKVLTGRLAINLEEQKWYLPLTFMRVDEDYAPTSALKYVLHRDLFGKVFAPVKIRMKFLREFFSIDEFVECLSKIEEEDQERILVGFFGDEAVCLDDLK